MDLHECVLNEYKEGKVFRLFVAKRGVHASVILYDSWYCFLKANCTHTMKIADTPHKVWIAAVKTAG